MGLENLVTLEDLPDDVKRRWQLDLKNLPILLNLPHIPELDALGKNEYGQPALERLVLDENDQPALDKSGNPYFSAQSNGLQFQNLISLWRILRASGVRIPKGPWLDAGMGRGLGIALMRHLVYPSEIGQPHIIAVDMGQENTIDARDVGRLVRAEYRRKTISPKRPDGINVHINVLNPQKLQEYTHSVKVRQPAIIGDEVYSEGLWWPVVAEQPEDVLAPLPPLAVVLSNQVLHWIKGDEDKIATFERLFSFMKPNGVLGMSMSTIGTAKHFLMAYKDVFESLGTRRLPDNQDGYASRLFEPDPIGSQEFDKMKDIIRDSGFDIVPNYGYARHEMVTYAHPLQYMEAVRRYGWDTVMRSVKRHHSIETQEKIWSAVKRRFLEVLVREGAWTPGEPYDYEQSNIYVVAVRRGEERAEAKIRRLRAEPVAAGVVAEAEPAAVGAVAATSGTVAGVAVASYINPVYLNRVIDRATKGESQIGLKLIGNAEMAGIKTAAPLEQILMGTLRNTVSDWDDTDAKPVMTVQYGLSDNVLLLQVQVKTGRERRPEEILGKRTFRALQDAGVQAEYRNLGGKERVYAFKMPVTAESG